MATLDATTVEGRRAAPGCSFGQPVKGAGCEVNGLFVAECVAAAALRFERWCAKRRTGRTMAGLAANERLPAGASEVDIVVDGHHPPLVESLRQLGWPVTTFPGHGPSGPVTVICVAVDQRRITELTNAIRRLAPNAFWTTQELGPVHAPSLPPGFIQVSS